MSSDVSDGASRSVSGSSFQRIGLVTPNTRLPMDFDAGVTVS